MLFPSKTIFNPVSLNHFAMSLKMCLLQ